MSLSQNDVVEYIKNLRLSEVKALIAALEQELGVSAAAPVMAGGAVAGGGAVAAPEPVEEQTEFNVVMTSFGENKIGVIKAVRALTGLGLKEAKDLVEGVPSTVKEGIEKPAALEAKKVLEEAGAKVELK